MECVHIRWKERCESLSSTFALSPLFPAFFSLRLYFNFIYLFISSLEMRHRSSLLDDDAPILVTTSTARLVQFLLFPFLTPLRPPCLPDTLLFFFFLFIFIFYRILMPRLTPASMSLSAEIPKHNFDDGDSAASSLFFSRCFCAAGWYTYINNFILYLILYYYLLELSP